MPSHIYGIKNCDTMKKALTWLDQHGHRYVFHDYKKEGADATVLARWCATVGREVLINTRGTTWRGLPESERLVSDDATAITLMQAHPSLIKRPVLELADGRMLVGFNAASYAAALEASAHD